ncbi:MAG: hypothetical protein AAF922_14305 [Pseudomonadota bacterium]
MQEGIASFIKDESGAISADWIVLTFGVICLGCLAVVTASDGTFGLADSIRNATAGTEVGGAATTDR